MTTQPTSALLTPEEYLAVEREAETRNEYVDGIVYAMTGASLSHIRIVTNLTAELALQLRGRPCEALSNEMKVRMPDSRKFFYPDIAVICGDPQFHDEHTDTILNPVLIIEVLSPSTEAFDRGLKFQSYQRLESLREYVLVAQDKYVVEQYVGRDDGKWTYSATIGRESSLSLPSVECTLSLQSVYDRVDLD